MKLSDAEKNLAAKSNELAQERDKNLILMKEMSDLRKQITDLLDENKQLKEKKLLTLAGCQDFLFFLTSANS